MSDPPLLKSRERLISYRYLNRAVKGATQARREGVRRVRASPPPRAAKFRLLETGDSKEGKLLQ